MNYKDIKQFPGANYSISCEWTYLADLLKGYTDHYGLDMDPPFQRGYVWQLEQKQRYIEYILQGGRSGRDIYFNCPGWMVGFEGQMQIVDGKQRVSTILAYLDNQFPVFGTHYHKDFSGKLRSTTADVMIHVNALDTQAEVTEWYLAINNGGTVHTEADLQLARDYLQQVRKL